MDLTRKTKDMTANIDIAPMTTSFVNRRLLTSARTIISASRLFRKCAKIGIRMFSVFRYRMAMQIAKINADVMLP